MDNLRTRALHGTTPRAPPLLVRGGAEVGGRVVILLFLEWHTLPAVVPDPLPRFGVGVGVTFEVCPEAGRTPRVTGGCPGVGTLPEH